MLEISYILGITFPLIMIALSALVIWKSSSWFEDGADLLGSNLEHGIKGATINAVASSMPEFLSTVFFLFFIDTDGLTGGIGITAGSAIFNILIIPAAVMFVVAYKLKIKTIKIDRKIIARDGSALIATTALFIAIIHNSAQIEWYHGAALVAIYIIYLFLLIFHQKSKREQPIVKIAPKEKLKAIYNIFRGVVVMCLGVWVLVKFTELLSSYSYNLSEIEVFNIHIVPFDIQLYGLNIPLILASLILAAAASSIPDTVLSVRDGLKGSYDDAISNAIGSNIFDISFALGLPILLFTLINGPIELSISAVKISLVLWYILQAINITSILLLYRKGEVNIKTAKLFATAYIVFTGLMLFLF